MRLEVRRAAWPYGEIVPDGCEPYRDGCGALVHDLSMWAGDAPLQVGQPYTHGAGLELTLTSAKVVLIPRHECGQTDMWQPELEWIEIHRTHNPSAGGS